MARQHDLKALAQLVEARTVQRQSSELSMARARAQVARLEQQRSQVLLALENSQSGWSAAVGSSSFNLAITGSWAAQVLNGQAQIGRVDSALAEAGREKDRQTNAWRLALANADLAEDLHTNATRQARRRKDEARLADMADRTAAKGGRA